MTLRYVLSSWKSTLYVLYLLPVSPTLTRTLLLSALSAPCRYSKAVLVSEAQGPERCKLCTGLPPSPTQQRLTSIIYHLFLLCLWGLKALFMWVSGGRNPEGYLWLSLSPSCTTLNSVLQGVVMYCICRFIKHARHRPEVQALLHVHMLPTSIIKRMHLCFLIYFSK